MHAVRHFRSGAFRVFELLAEHFTPEQVSKLDTHTWSNIFNVELLQWLTERFSIQLPGQVFNWALERNDLEFIDFWIEKRPEKLPNYTLSRALYSEATWPLFVQLVSSKNIARDEEERHKLILQATREEDLALLKLLHLCQTEYPFTKPPIEAFELAVANGYLEFVEQLCVHHDGIITPHAFEVAAYNGHVHVLQFMLTRSTLEGVPEAMDARCGGDWECQLSLCDPVMEVCSG
jgi:hypothetical protein